MTRRPASRTRSLRLRAAAPAALLALLALTACEQTPVEDTRPVLTEDEFFDEVDALAAVESIDRTGEDEPDDPESGPDDGTVTESTDGAAAGDAFATYSTEVCDPGEEGDFEEPDQPYPVEADDAGFADSSADTSTAPDAGRDVVTLHADADSVDLRVAERAIIRLYDDYQYKDGPPRISLVSGRFTTEAPDLGRHSSQHDSSTPGTRPLNLVQLPHLAALPDVDSGVLQNNSATLRLEAGTDLRGWVGDNAEAPGGIRLSVTSPSEDGDESQLPACGDSIPIADTTASPVDPRLSSFGLTLGADTVAEDVETLFDTADASGATLLTGSVGDRSSQFTDGGSLWVESADDLADVHDAILAAYGQSQQGGFLAKSSDGFTVEFDDIGMSMDEALEAREQIAAAGAELPRIRMGRGSTEVVADDPEVLREIVRTVNSSEWPLRPERTITVSRTADAAQGVRFDPAVWDDRGALIAELWEAEFSEVYTGTQNRDSDVGLVLRESADGNTMPDVTRPEGRDALVSAMRDGGWTGDLTVSITHGDANVTFRTTATGPATQAYNGLAGVDSDPPPWGQELIAAWDATAG